MSARSITVLPGRPVSRTATAPVSVGDFFRSRPSSRSLSVRYRDVSCSLKLTSGCLWKYRRRSTTSSSTVLLGSGVVASFSFMYGDETVTASRGVHERCAQAGLELVQTPAQGQKRGVHRGVGRVVTEEPGLNQVACGRGFRALGQEKHECRLLLRETDLALVHAHHALRRVELQAPEAVGARPPGATLDQARREIGVDVRHRHVALDEVGARPQLVRATDGGRVDLGRGQHDHGQARMMLPYPGQQLEARVFVLIEHEVEQDGGDTLAPQHLARPRHAGGYRWSVTEVVEIDAELLQHRRLVLDDQHRRAQHVGRSVDFEARRERREAYLAPGAVAGAAPQTAVFQGPNYTILNDN